MSSGAVFEKQTFISLKLFWQTIRPPSVPPLHPVSLTPLQKLQPERNSGTYPEGFQCWEFCIPCNVVPWERTGQVQ